MQTGVWLNRETYSVKKTTKHYQWSVFPLTNGGHHGSQVCFPLLLVFILWVPDQIGVDSLAVVETLQPVQLPNIKQENKSAASYINAEIKTYKYQLWLLNCQNVLEKH